MTEGLNDFLRVKDLMLNEITCWLGWVSSLRFRFRGQGVGLKMLVWDFEFETLGSWVCKGVKGQRFRVLTLAFGVNWKQGLSL